ncbi:hypothetical protein BWK47_09365 [Synechocystis sp. CACIAM 05]|nr:hypothetical protein BWK47_09365 [Synechocystis sp. CACIAM 05]
MPPDFLIWGAMGSNRGSSPGPKAPLLLVDRGDKTFKYLLQTRVWLDSCHCLVTDPGQICLKLLLISRGLANCHAC